MDCVKTFLKKTDNWFNLFNHDSYIRVGGRKPQKNACRHQQVSGTDLVSGVNVSVQQVPDDGDASCGVIQPKEVWSLKSANNFVHKLALKHQTPTSHMEDKTRHIYILKGPILNLII